MLGGALAIGILFLFLRRLRPTLIIAVSLPASVLFIVRRPLFENYVPYAFVTAIFYTDANVLMSRCLDLKRKRSVN